MKEWVLEKLLQNQSFSKLPEKTKYILPSQIAKELQEVYEAKGQVFIDAYKAELSMRLLRTNWLWVQNPKFPFQKWNKIKAEIAKVLAGQDRLNKVPLEVIAAQMDVLNACVDAIVEHTTIKQPKWVKNPKGGWMRTPK